MNSLKERLQKGETLYGLGSLLPSSQLQEMVSLSGFDFSMIDFEHGLMEVGIAENMLRSLKGSSTVGVLRIPPGDYNMVGKVLDMGATVVQIPQIESKEEAEKAVRAAKYPPRGNRGSAHVVRAAQYTAMDRKLFYGSANDETMVILQIEGLKASQNAAEIMDVEGVDIIFLGPVDLSNSLGVPGQIEHPLVEEKMLELVNLAKSKGKFVGTYVETKAAADKWKACGVQYLMYQSDIEMIFDQFKDTAAMLKK